MNRWIVVAVLAGATLAHAQTPPAKKELVAKVLQLQQPGIEAMSRQIAQGPVLQMMQEARRLLQTQVPADKREAIAKSIEADAQKFTEEATTVVRDQAVKLAPSTVGSILEEKFSEDELKTLITWLESPVNRKYQQLGPEMQNGLVQKLMAETGPMLDTKLLALRERTRVALGLPPPDAASRPARPAASAARPASKAASK